MIVERQYVNPMEMTFIGKDGSMGLRHGKTYRVLMFCADGYVWVSWNDRDDCMKVCPYASLNTLYANWKTPAPKLSNEGAYKIIAKHLYRAHRMYTGGKTLVILADSIEEATEKARAALDADARAACAGAAAGGCGTYRQARAQAHLGR